MIPHSALHDEIWVVTEGAAGMENQCLGLAERLPLPVRTFRVHLNAPWRWLAPYSIGSALEHLAPANDRLAAPWPRLLIACGRQSIPVSLAVKRASLGRTIAVQCQDPRINARNFDLVIPPEHDGIAGENVFPIVGSPNRITPTRLAEAREEFAGRFAGLRAPRVAALIGGKSRTHGGIDVSSARRLGRMLANLAKECGLMVSASRRTPEVAAQILRESLDPTDAFSWDGTGANPYLGMLAWADAFVVTADSVNMICEAATTGRPVHVFPLAHGRRRAKAFQGSLQGRGIIRVFSGQIQQWSYQPLDETGRAADRIKALLDARTDAADMSA
jgi:mitochondrial fission protein ELM1